MYLLVPILLDLALPIGTLSMIGLALMFSICLAALFHIAASVLQSGQLNAIAKEEFAAVIFSIIIIFFWITSDGLLNSVVSGLVQAALPSGTIPPINCAAGSTGCSSGFTTTHIDFADASLEIMFEKMKSAYMSLFMFEVLIGFLSTISFPFGTPVGIVAIISVSLAPFSGLNLLSQAHTVVVESISYLMSVIWAKQFILYFARDAVPTLLLPLGFVLRAFPLFRTTGSTIIAVCFALYFAFPFSILLSNYLIFDVFDAADFNYNPSISSPFATARSESSWTNDVVVRGHGGPEVEALRDQFAAPDLISQSSTRSTCGSGSVIDWLLCSPQNIYNAVVSVGHGIARAYNTVRDMLIFVLGLTGDFLTSLILNPLFPSSVTAGLYYFVIQEVSIVSPIIILVTVTSIIEIIITLTMFRNVSLLIGGEAEIIGISRVV